MSLLFALLFLAIFPSSALPAALRYELTLSVDVTGTFWGEASVTMPRVAVQQRETLFRLYPNHFGPFLRIEEAYYLGKPLAMDSVDPTVVVVLLPEGLPQTVSVQLKFSGVLPKDLLGYGIFAHTPAAMTLSQCYPILVPWDEDWLLYPPFSHGDNLVAEVADYLVDLAVPLGWIPIGSGDEEELGPGSWRIRGENLREFGLVLVSGYEAIEGKWEGLKMRVFSTPELKFAAQRALAFAQECLALFTAMLGPFPYPDLDFVIVPLVKAGGVEYPRLILIGQEYAQDPNSPFFAEIVAHEVAHQWWYGEVGTDQVGEPWLDEGLATFTSALYFEERGELGAMVATWRARYARAKAVNPTASVGSPLGAFPEGAGYSGYIYAGAALFLQEVRMVLGDTRFFEALRAFRQEFQWRIAHGCDLLKLFGEEEALRKLREHYFGGLSACGTGDGP